jgi:hypothetical protein
MCPPCRCLRLARKAGKIGWAIVAFEEASANELDRYRAVDCGIMSLVDHAYGTATQPTFNPIAANLGRKFGLGAIVSNHRCECDSNVGRWIAARSQVGPDRFYP